MCALDWLRIKRHQSIKVSNNIKAGCESNRPEVSRQKFELAGQSMEWLTIAVLTGSENPCFLLLWVALNKSITNSSSPLCSSFWNVFQQKSKCYSARIRNVIQWGSNGKVSREKFSQWQKCVLCSAWNQFSDCTRLFLDSSCSTRGFPTKKHIVSMI